MKSNNAKNKSLLILVVGLWVGVFLGAGALWALNWLGVISLDLGQLGLSLDSNIAPAKDMPAPDFSLSNLQNQQVSLGDMQDKVIVLNFWATWCAPCVQEMIYFQEAQDRNPENLLVLAINQEEKPDIVSDFIQDMGFTFEVLLDESGQITKLYKVLALPNTYFIDREGVIRFHHMGSLSEEQLDVYLVQMGLTP